MLNRVVFAGSPEAAVVVLDALVSDGVDVVRVVTQPDTRRGRGNQSSPTPVKLRALELNIEVRETVEDLVPVADESSRIDAVIVVAYGRLIPKSLLEPATGVPMLNVHFSLLPRWRGAAPVERAILEGDSTTGVCIMGMEETLDTGPVYAVCETTIEDDDTTSSLTKRLAELGAKELIDVLRRWPVDAVQQSGETTYAHKITARDLVIDWSNSATSIERQVRAVAAHTTTGAGRRVRILDARADHQLPETDSDLAMGAYAGNSRIVCGSGSLLVTRVQPEGKSGMSFDAWANGARLTVGDRFGHAL